MFKAQTAVHIIYIWKITVPCKDAYSSILHLCFLNTIFCRPDGDTALRLVTVRLKSVHPFLIASCYDSVPDYSHHIF